MFLVVASAGLVTNLNAQTGQPASAQKGVELSPGQTAVITSDSSGSKSTTTRDIALPSASPNSINKTNGTPSQPADDKKKPKR